MRKFLWPFLVLVLTAASLTFAYAQNIGVTFPNGIRYPGGGSPPVTCSNSLDFSASCNSQYLGVTP